MTAEIIVEVPFREIEPIVEKLNNNLYFSIFYNEPIQITKTENGFDYVKMNNVNTDLCIYIETEDNMVLEEQARNIQKLLNVSLSQTKYKIMDRIENQIFQPDDIVINDHWILAYSKKEYPNKNVIYFEPQTAFGTGLHETTQECLNIILRHDFSSARVADLGTGSGILSIAAALKHAKYIEAYDIQPVKNEVLHNANLNHVKQIEIKQKDLLHSHHKLNNDFDWYFINIGANETIEIIEHSQLFKSSANFLVSGLVDWNYKNVQAFFIKNGYSVIDKKHKNDWVTILFKKI